MTDDEKKRTKEKVRKRAYYEANKAHIIAKAVAWNKAHPEIARERTRAHYRRNKKKKWAQVKTWRAANPEKYRAQQKRSGAGNRARHLRKKFKLTPEQYEEMLAKQNGVCAICGRTETRIGRGGKVVPLAVDHCHASGRIRALLCDACNGGLARFRDDPSTLRRAADYLERP